MKTATAVFPVKLAGPQSAGSYHPITPVPVRVLDTRVAGGAKVPSGTNPTVTLAKALAGLGALASAVAINLTVTDAEGSGFHSAYAGVRRWLTSVTRAATLPSRTSTGTARPRTAPTWPSCRSARVPTPSRRSP